MTSALKNYGLYIGGEWHEPANDDGLEVINPATEEAIGTVPQGSIADVDRAVAAARKAYVEGPWRRMSARERSDALLRFMQEVSDRRADLVNLIISETGAARWVAESLQFDTGYKYALWFAERTASYPFQEPLPAQAGARGLGQGVIIKEPIGVVACVTPFNFPLYLNLSKVIPALAMGNTVVLKPSPYTPLQAFVLGEIADAVGLPPGVLNIVTGDADAGERLTTHPDVDMISFTGSDFVGKKVMGQAADGLKKVLLELGGKSPNIAFAGTDPAKFAASAAAGFTIHAGQGCALPTRILADRSIYNEIVEAMTASLARVRVGDPADPKVTMGPLIREVQRERVERYVAAGTSEGATLAHGGSRPDGLDKGFFFNPTLFTDVDASMSVAQDEIFGPVGVVIPFDGDEEGIRIANDTRYGLAASVWHPNPVRAFEIAQEIEAGTVSINGGGGGPNLWGPFGGYKQSGIGREYGDYGLLEYAQLKTVTWSAGRPLTPGQQTVPTDEEFRAELRSWLAAHPPPDLRVAATPDDAETLREWQRTLHDGGWVGIHWPTEYGGRDASMTQVAIYNEELVRAGAPDILGGVGITLVGPTLMAHGTEEQRARWMPRILAGDDVWAQLFSEPGAGSDLAGLTTRAERRGDVYIVSGQKVWSTHAQFADWGIALVRTDPAALKSKGISMLAVDMRSPGVDVRPLRQLTGESEFNEVFLDEVEVPADQLIGPEHGGWQVANTTLANERGGGFIWRQQVRTEVALDELWKSCAADGRLDDPIVRQRLASTWVDVEVLRLHNARTLARPRGEEIGAESSLVKLVWAQASQGLYDAACDVLGPETLLASSEWGRGRLATRANSIMGGTSEIQRTVIGERILGLPREPRP